MVSLIADQFLFVSKRHALEKLFQTCEVWVDAGGPEFAGIKGIVRQQGHQKRAEFYELMRFNGAAIGETGYG
jgi:hypothetical protein